MAFQEKYYFTFKPTGIEESHRVEIWQDTVDVLVAEEVTAGDPPFVVELPEVDNKFQSVRGTGCVIRLLSDTNFKFFDGLYTENLQEFKVFHYIDGVLNWCGYLNSEMFAEPYDQETNYIVEFSGNDGLNLAERLFFNESDASKYTGLKTEWELLQIVLGKIDLPYSDIRISLSTTFTGYSAAAQNTILHETYLESSNFYDEDDKPMNLKEVIESILKPYAAFIEVSDGSLYISDVNAMAAGGNVSYKRYNASTYAYIDTVVEDNEIDVSEIGYLGTGQQIEQSGGTNRQVVRYSPYPNKDITEELLVTPSEFGTVPPTFSTKDGYVYKTLDDHFFYNATSPSDFEESADSESSPDRYVYLRHIYTGLLQIRAGQYPYVSLQSSELRDEQPGERLGSRRYLDGVSIIISGKALAKTKANPYDDTYTQADIDRGADKLTRVGIQFGLLIGNKSYSSAGSAFVDGANYNNYLIVEDGGNIISNKWVDFSFKANVNYSDDTILINGILDLVFFQGLKAQITGGNFIDLPATDVLQEVWVRNLKIAVANNDGSEVSDQDLEYTGILNKNIQKDGEDVEITTGTASVFADRGKKVYNDGSNYKTIKEWTRASQTYKIEELLLNSLSSNFKQGFYTLSNMNLKNSFAPINVITDSYTGSRKFMQKSFTRDYYNYVCSCELVEITEDELTIVKE